MDIRFLPHNSHLERPDSFEERDPHLRLLRERPLIYRSEFLDLLPRRQAGIYTVSGGRQIGKTTLLKQWMSKHLQDGLIPNSIVYMTGELIDDHHSLVRLLTEIIQNMPNTNLHFILLDEVTYIRDWDKGVKFLADAGMLENVVLLLTGSDLVIIQEARMRFPGRRGTAKTIDYHLYPLSFFQTIKLKGRFSNSELDQISDPRFNPTTQMLDILYEEFDHYIIHGGFLTAINDVAKQNSVTPTTLATYSDWIRGDILKRGKQENYLREILSAIIDRYGSQVTWNALSRDLSIDHPKTVADYVALLVSMDAAFVQSALEENKLKASPKKARKLMFSDPFVFHAVRAWLKPCDDPHSEQINQLLSSPKWKAKLVEACTVTHYRRHFPTYYIKAKGEIDIAYVDKNRFWPLEIKWTQQLRPKDLKQIVKYTNSRVLTRTPQRGDILGVPTEPLPLALFRLG